MGPGIAFSVEGALAVLGRTPGTLRSLLDGMPDPWIEHNEGEETFSPFDVVGHLIHGERCDWVARARIIMDQGENRPFDPFDRFAMYRESQGKSMPDLLNEFATLREANVRTVAGWGLRPEHLALRGSHPALGAVTLQELLSTWVVHDLGHLAQIARVMAKQYREEVGPWGAYLPILQDREGGTGGSSR